jgi:hypothetical protein
VECIWSNNTGCSGGGTPVVANQLLYAPNGFGTYNGSVFNAETGTGAGSYVADNPGAFTTDTGYFLQSGTLRGAGWGAGIPLSGLSAGDGLLVVPNGTKVNAYVLSTNP